MIVPGRYDDPTPTSRNVLDLVRQAYERSARLASVCSGAFVLAQAGVLDGLTATTHWNLCGALRNSFPRVTVDERPLYVDCGQVLTSAGLAAGLDLCIHMIRTDHGVRAANRVARSMVFAPHRSGGQAQFIDQFPPTSSGGQELLEWIVAHLDEPLTLQDIARHANISTRTQLRRFTAQTGQSPQRWLTAQRVRRARELLESTSDPVEKVARRSGFGTAASMRLHFRREVGMSPQSYRGAHGIAG